MKNNNEFTVKSPPTSPKLIPSLIDLTIVVTIAALLQIYANETAIVVRAALYLYVISILKSLFQPKTQQDVCSIRILPFGVQIEEYINTSINGENTDRAKVGKIQFLPKECIIDVIVTEVVLSYKVVSVVVFRIAEEGKDCADYKQKIKDALLVTAFDPDKVEMTFDECMLMRAGIRNALQMGKEKESNGNHR